MIHISCLPRGVSSGNFLDLNGSFCPLFSPNAPVRNSRWNSNSNARCERVYFRLKYGTPRGTAFWFLMEFKNSLKNQSPESGSSLLIWIWRQPQLGQVIVRCTEIRFVNRDCSLSNPEKSRYQTLCHSQFPVKQRIRLKDIQSLRWRSQAVRGMPPPKVGRASVYNGLEEGG